MAPDRSVTAYERLKGKVPKTGGSLLRGRMARLQQEKYVEADYYTLGVWRVKEGREPDFIEAWKAVGVAFSQLPDPPGPGVLVRSESDPDLFYSFGPWKRLEDIQAMRGDAKSNAALQKLMSLCTKATPGAYRVVARAPGASM